MFKQYNCGEITVSGDHLPSGEAHGRLIVAVPGISVQAFWFDHNRPQTFIKYDHITKKVTSGIYDHNVPAYLLHNGSAINTYYLQGINFFSLYSNIVRAYTIDMS